MALGAKERPLGKTLAVCNMKGGVGKTTLSIMIAESLSALANKSVLVLDLDAQGSLSYAMMGRSRYEQALSSKRVLSKFFEAKSQNKPISFSGCVVEKASLLKECASLDLAPSDMQLQLVERQAIGKLAKLSLDNLWKDAPEATTAAWLRSEVRALRGKYDWIIFDCPPGISIFAYAGIACSDAILMPMTPDYLSMQAIRTMVERFLPQLATQHRPKRRLTILNKCRAGVSAVAEYRDALRRESASPIWGVEFIPIELPLREKIAQAADAEEDRNWDRFKDKFDVEDCRGILSFLEG